MVGVNNESEGAWKLALMPVSLETLKGSEGVKIEEEGALNPAASDPLIGVGLTGCQNPPRFLRLY